MHASKKSIHRYQNREWHRPPNPQTLYPELNSWSDYSKRPKFQFPGRSTRKDEADRGNETPRMRIFLIFHKGDGERTFNFSGRTFNPKLFNEKSKMVCS